MSLNISFLYSSWTNKDDFGKNYICLGSNPNLKRRPILWRVLIIPKYNNK